MALFSQNAKSLSSTNGKIHKVEFKAGRMYLVSNEEEGVTKKIVHPDLRQGLICLYSDDDGLTHFCWKERSSEAVEEDLIIFPDDCEFKKVECKDGRVFVLKWKLSTRKMLFWLQEPSTDKDVEYLRQVNELLNKPDNRESQREGNNLQNMIGNLSQRQLMRLLNTVGQMGSLSSSLGSTSQPAGEAGESTDQVTASTSSDTATTPGEAAQESSTSTRQVTVSEDPCDEANCGESGTSDSQDEDQDMEEE